MIQHYLKRTDEMGRGLYALYDLEANKILFTAELLVLNVGDTVALAGTDLRWYTFKYDDKRDCLVLGDGEIFNHSDKPNIGYKLIDYDGRKVMMFYTLRDIERDEQLFIDYSADVAVDASKYTVNMLGDKK